MMTIENIFLFLFLALGAAINIRDKLIENNYMDIRKLTGSHYIRRLNFFYLPNDGQLIDKNNSYMKFKLRFLTYLILSLILGLVLIVVL